MHPSKEEVCAIIQTSSIYGSAKPTQEAENMIKLKRINNYGCRIGLEEDHFNAGLVETPMLEADNAAWCVLETRSYIQVT